MTHNREFVMALMAGLLTELGYRMGCRTPDLALASYVSADRSQSRSVTGLDDNTTALVPPKSFGTMTSRLTFSHR